MGMSAELEEVVPAVRAPLKWAGGKRWLVRHIARLWKPEEHRRLVELSGAEAQQALRLLLRNQFRQVDRGGAGHSCADGGVTSEGAV